MYTCVDIYVYTYIHREREREREPRGMRMHRGLRVFVYMTSVCVLSFSLTCLSFCNQLEDLPPNGGAGPGAREGVFPSHTPEEEERERETT